MKIRITPCLIIIVSLLAIVLLLLVAKEEEFFKGGGGGFAMRGGGPSGGGMRGFAGPSPMVGPGPMGPKPMGPIPGPPPPMPPPGPPGPHPGPIPKPHFSPRARGYGGVGWAAQGIPAYSYFRDYPLAYSYGYALETGQCLNGCCDIEECRLGNGCKFSSNGRKYIGENPDSCIYHKKCVKDNVEKLATEDLEVECSNKSKSKLIV